MHVKFIARGTGSAKAAADYRLGERDAAGQVREGVEVRRGDPDVVAAVADSLELSAQVRLRRDRVGAGGPSDRRAEPAGTNPVLSCTGGVLRKSPADRASALRPATIAAVTVTRLRGVRTELCAVCAMH